MMFYYQGIGNGQDVNKESGSGSSAIKMLLTGSSSMESQSQSQSSQNMVMYTIISLTIGNVNFFGCFGYLHTWK